MSQEQPQRFQTEQVEEQQQPLISDQKANMDINEPHQQHIKAEDQRPSEIDIKPEVSPKQQDEPIKYGDVFPVKGELANEPIKPQDAAMMQSAENLVLGQTQKGGVASVMQSAAARNERAGLVGHEEANPIPADRGVTVAETDLPGAKIITESVGGQVVAQLVMPTPVPTEATDLALGPDPSLITIGEALEASGMSAADKPIDHSDAAAIMAAEARATGHSMMSPGGVAAQAQAAADANERVDKPEEKTTLGDVLTDATLKLPADKIVTVEDAQKVMSAEIRNKDDTGAHPGGVAASVAAAARLNVGDPAV